MLEILVSIANFMFLGTTSGQKPTYATPVVFGQVTPQFFNRYSSSLSNG